MKENYIERIESCYSISECISMLNDIKNTEEKDLTKEEKEELYIKILEGIKKDNKGLYLINNDKINDLDNVINMLIATIKNIIPTEILDKHFDENKLKDNFILWGYGGKLLYTSTDGSFYDEDILTIINGSKNLSEEQKKELYKYFLFESNPHFKSILTRESYINVVKNTIPTEILDKYFDENKLRKKTLSVECIREEINKLSSNLIRTLHHDYSPANFVIVLLEEIEKIDSLEDKEELYIKFLTNLKLKKSINVLCEKSGYYDLEKLIKTIKEKIPTEILDKHFDEEILRKAINQSKNKEFLSNPISFTSNPAAEEEFIDAVRKKIHLLSMYLLDSYDKQYFYFYPRIIEDINKIKNADAKYELSSELVEELKEYLINAKWLNEEELKEEIEDLIEYIESDMDVNILKENKINLKDIKKKRKIKEIKYLKEITEIEKLDDKIKEKENNIYNRMMPSKLIEILEQELSFCEEEIKKLNKEPEKNKNNIKVYTDLVNEITKEKEKLIKNKEYCSSKVLKDIIEKRSEDDYDEIKKEAIIEFEKNIEKEITNLEKEKNSLEKSIKSSDVLQQEYDELKLKLESSKLTIKEESKTIKVFIDNKEIIRIKDNHLANLYKDYQKNPEKNEQKIKDRVLKLKENEIQDNENKISRLIEKKSEIESKKEIKKEFDSINELKKQKEAYYNILSDGISQYEEKENDENVNEEIENFVNNHEQLKVFEGYERKNELIQELFEQIQEGIKTKPVIFAEGMKSLWDKALKKALPFALGTVVGFKLSMFASAVPLVREVLLVTSLTKITISTLNKLADKAKQYEETGECKGKKPGKLATGALKLRNKVTGIVSDKKPNLVEKTSKMKEKMKQTPINYFLNGVSIGYIVGSIYQMPKGIFDGTKDATNAVVDNATQNAGTVETVTETVETVTEAVTETAEIIDFNNIDTTINNLEKLMEQGLIPKEGTVMDLSSILRGYISSDATSSVALMEEVANDVIFEKIAASPTGELMCHFKQANGLGYSWVKLEDVLKVAGKTLVKTMTK